MRMCDSIFGNSSSATSENTTSAQCESKRGTCDGYNYEYVPEFGWRCDLHLPDGTPQYIYLDLLEHLEINNRLYDACDIAEELNAETQLVTCTAKRLGIVGHAIARNETDFHRLYSQLSYEIIKSEVTWKKQLETLDDRLSTFMVAKVLGRADPYVDSTAPLLHSYKSKKDGKYSKCVLDKLRIHERQFKQHEGWLSSAELTKKVGYRNPTWAEKRFESLGHKPEQRRGRRGRLSNLYSPESVELLRDSERNRARGGEMMTGCMIARTVLEETGLQAGWTENRLKQYRAISEQRDDDQGKTRTHYPPSVLADLIVKATQIIAETKENDNLWSSRQVCEFYGYNGEQLGKVQKFLAKHATPAGLKRYSRPGDDRLIITTGYDPDEIEQLATLFIRHIEKTIKHKQAHGNFNQYDYEYLRGKIPLDLVKADHYQPLAEQTNS